MADLILMNMIHLDKLSHLYQGDLLTVQLPSFYFHYLHIVSVSYQNLIFFVKVIFFHQHYVEGISTLFFCHIG